MFLFYAPPPLPQTLSIPLFSDGSAYYDTYENVFISASEGAAYGGNSLKSGQWKSRQLGPEYVCARALRGHPSPLLAYSILAQTSEVIQMFTEVISIFSGP